MYAVIRWRSVKSGLSVMPDENGSRFRISEADLHRHLRARMSQRGVTRQEVERTLNDGWAALDAKPGTVGKVCVFPYRDVWEGRFFEEKEVTLYYRVVNQAVVLLTVKARYGRDFVRGNAS